MKQNSLYVRSIKIVDIKSIFPMRFVVNEITLNAVGKSIFAVNMFHDFISINNIKKYISQFKIKMDLRRKARIYLYVFKNNL